MTVFWRCRGGGVGRARAIRRQSWPAGVRAGRTHCVTARWTGWLRPSWRSECKRSNHRHTGQQILHGSVLLRASKILNSMNAVATRQTSLDIQLVASRSDISFHRLKTSSLTALLRALPPFGLGPQLTVRRTRIVSLIRCSNQPLFSRPLAVKSRHQHRRAACKRITDILEQCGLFSSNQPLPLKAARM
jgi:hypothetical protein